MDPSQSRGRSRGRSTGTPGPSSESIAAAHMRQQRGPKQPPPPASERPPQLGGRATVRPPTAPAATSGRPRPAPGGGGDAPPTQAMERLQLGGAAGGGGDAAVAPQGRGGLRGRREIAPVLRTRPSHVVSKTGTAGKSIELQANYFKLLTQTDWCLYQYRVDFAPDVERTFVRKKLLRLHQEKFGGYIFDGTLMFTIARLHPDPMELLSTTEEQEKIVITVRKVADLAIGDPCYIQLFNILMRSCLESLNLQLVGRDYYDAKAKVNIPEHKLELWPGYTTSIRQHENSILLNVEVTHKVMRLETAWDVMNECWNRDSRNWKDLFLNAIVGVTVLTDYNNKTYRIDDIDFSVNPLSTFDMKGEKVSFADYYKKKYGLSLRDMEQPMLISRATARQRRSGMSETIILIPELCRVTGMTDEMRNNMQLMRALAEHTRVAPGLRIKKYGQFMERLQNSQKAMEELKMWNMQLSNSLLKFNSRVIPEEKILLGRNAAVEAGEDADWTRGLRGKSVLLNANQMNWGVVFTRRMSREAKMFVQTLQKSAASLQINVPPPRIEELDDDRAGSYVESIDRLISSSNPDIIMTIVPNNRSDRYSAIKKKSCVDRSVPTQVVLAKNMTSKGVMSIATKIAIQMQCKVGGAPWTVEIPIKNAMIVGFDVSRDTYTKGKSFGAVVASLNKDMTQYYSAVSPHTNGEELSNQIGIQLLNACRKYREYNNTLPEKIFIYRDGVGEGQLNQVYAHEVELIKAKLSELYGQEPKMAFIVVTKRITSRFFCRGENPPPGTVVDDHVTSPERYDFFLVSQSVKQGTVSPTSYNVLYDTINLPPCRMQRFTYKLTHLYYNWSGTVRVPAPCQYAHKLAFIVGQYIHRSPHQDLCDRLYFL